MRGDMQYKGLVDNTTLDLEFGTKTPRQTRNRNRDFYLAGLHDYAIDSVLHKCLDFIRRE